MTDCGNISHNGLHLMQPNNELFQWAQVARHSHHLNAFWLISFRELI